MRRLVLAALVLLAARGIAAAQPSLEPAPSPPPPPIEPVAAAPQATAARASLPAKMTERWHRARVLYGVGTAMGLVGNGLTLASIVIVSVTDYPCNPYDPKHATNPNDSCNPNGAIFKPPRPTDPAPLLAYIGSSTSALGFVFTASGLGYQHHLLDELDADVGRGYFHAGTTLGLLGFFSVGASYFFGFTDYLNAHDQGVAILTTSIGGAALCAIGGLLYSVDSSRLNRAWRRISTF